MVMGSYRYSLQRLPSRRAEQSERRNALADVMNSRERVLAALRRQDVDYVPCCCFFSGSLAGPQHTWKGRADSLDLIVNGLGLDSHVGVSVGVSRHPEVTERVWHETSDEGQDILWKEIGTPAGPLTAAVQITDDWPHGDDLPLNSDWTVSRFIKPWLQTMDDVERYRYVHLPPSDGVIAQARSRYDARKKVADEYGVITYAGCGMGLTAAIQLFGAQDGVFLSMDQPDCFVRFLEIEHEATMRCAEVLAELGVDVICRNGFYETMDFWSPTQIKNWLVPLLEKEIDAMHAGGAAVTYTVCTGIMPMLDILADLEFDAYNSIEPVLTGQDMDLVSDALCDKHAIWGGVSGPYHIGEGTPEMARQAVREAFEVFGPRGLVLNAVPSIRAHWPWENAQAMFDEWRKLRAGG
jgi:uroporphyrinogen-III decarboxylase